MSPIPKNQHGKVCIFSKNHKDLKNIKKSLNICKYLPITTKNNRQNIKKIRNLKKVYFLFFWTPNMGQRKIFFFF